MPYPTTAIQRPELGVMANEFALEQSRSMFVGQLILPFFMAQQVSANFPYIPAGELLKGVRTERAANGGYNRADFGFTQGNFTCKEYGMEVPVSDAEAEAYRIYLDAEEVAMQMATDVLLRNYEKRVADIVAAQTPHAVSTKWSTKSTAKPGEDVDAGKKAIQNATGMWPDTLVISYTTFRNVLNTDAVSGAIKYTAAYQTFGMERQMQVLADFFGVNRVLVAGGSRNSANEGQAMSLTSIWNDAYGFLCVTNTGTPKMPQFGRTVVFAKDSDAPLTVETYRDETVRSTIVRARHWTDEKVITAGAGYLLSNLA